MAALSAAVAGALLVLFVFYRPGAVDDPDRADLPAAAGADKEALAEAGLPTGWVTVDGPWGNRIARIRVVVFNNSWVALPTRACIGGATFRFKGDDGEEKAVDSGLWVPDSPLVLWHMEEKKILAASPPLASWQQGVPLRWRALAADAANSKAAVISGVSSKGMFLYAGMPAAMDEPGVFMQQGSVVGWTFGQQEPGGYFWTNRAWDGLSGATVWVHEFYEKTFANGREEQFLRALAMGDDVPLQTRLRALIEGLGLEPRLAKADTPASLDPDAILARIQGLTIEILRRGRYREILGIFRDPFLLERIDDDKTIGDVILKVAGSYGYRRAIALAEAAMITLQQMPATSSRIDLNGLRAHLYREWLREYIAKGNADGGLRIFYEARRHYADDPELVLLGVELSLLDFDWQSAENLINSTTYPPYLEERVNTLLAQIEALKPKPPAGEEGIKISFPPGHVPIPVTARINGALTQRFLIDTGATMVTLPYSMVEDLGIAITADTPQRQVSTAGGVTAAWEIELSSVELEGWIEYDVKALVLDIPEQPGLGLLGLNYLKRFRMDLDTEQGRLVLTPQKGQGRGPQAM